MQLTSKTRHLVFDPNPACLPHASEQRWTRRPAYLPMCDKYHVHVDHVNYTSCNVIKFYACGFDSLPTGQLFMLCGLQIVFQIQTFRKILSGIPSEYQTIWIQIRPGVFIGPGLDPNCLQRLSADGTSR